MARVVDRLWLEPPPAFTSMTRVPHKSGGLHYVQMFGNALPRDLRAFRESGDGHWLAMESGDKIQARLISQGGENQCGPFGRRYRDGPTGFGQRTLGSPSPSFPSLVRFPQTL
jgi:hypothetical protein